MSPIQQTSKNVVGTKFAAYYKMKIFTMSISYTYLHTMLHIYTDYMVREIKQLSGIECTL